MTTAGEGGLVMMVAPHISNAGWISAPSGQVILAASATNLGFRFDRVAARRDLAEAAQVWTEDRRVRLLLLIPLATEQPHVRDPTHR